MVYIVGSGALAAGKLLHLRRGGTLPPFDERLCARLERGDRAMPPPTEHAGRWSTEDLEIGSHAFGFWQHWLVDATALPDYPDFMDLQLPPELEAKLDRLAAATGRRPDQLALDLLASSVDHDDWFRGEVERGRESARAGQLLDHDEVASRIKQRYGG